MDSMFCVGLSGGSRLQFAGGFDAESMKAFEELRSRMNKQPNDENTPEA